jgi:hypothetical protein
MNDPGQFPQSGNLPQRHEIYVPGYAGAKTIFILLGLLLLGLSLDKLRPAWDLALHGGRALAEAECIVRTEPDGSQEIFTTDDTLLAAIKAGEGSRDRRSVYWVEYRFTTADGRQIHARSPLGQHVKPLQPLRDQDGFPSSSWIWYQQGDPEQILLPLQMGTWYLPGMLALFGSLAVIIGSLLRWSAKRPIEMPDLTLAHAERDDEENGITPKKRPTRKRP